MKKIRTREMSMFRKGNTFLTYDIYQRAKKKMKNKMKQTEFAEVIKGFHELIVELCFRNGSVDLPKNIGSIDVTFYGSKNMLKDDIFKVILCRSRKGKRYTDIHGCKFYRGYYFRQKTKEAYENNDYVACETFIKE